MSYAPPVSTSVGTASTAGADNPEYIVKGELNNDGLIDLVTVNETDGEVAVLLNNGAGGFSSAAATYTAGTEPRQVAIGDLDGDGFNDLVVPNTGSGNVTVMLNDGDGTFTQAPGSPIDIVALAGAGSKPTSPAIADFDGDGNLDIAVTNDDNTDNAGVDTDTFQILLGQGDGTFTGGATIATGDKPTYTITADANSDGNADLIVANFLDGTVSVQLGDGLGGFALAAGSPFATGSRPWSLRFQDMDGDAISDLVLVNYNANSNVRVFKGADDGTFSALFATANGQIEDKPHSTEIVDLDSDGDLDIVVSNDNDPAVPATNATTGFTVLLGDGAGAFPTVKHYPVAGQPNGVVSLDLDGTGLIDLAVANGSTGEVDVLLSVPTTGAPVAEAGNLSVPSAVAGGNTATAGMLSGTDADGALLKFAIASQGANGTVAITDVETGAFTYTPNGASYVLPDSFTFTVDDGTGASAAATVQVVQNDPPVITSNGGGASAAVTVDEGEVAVTTVAATDADAGQTLTYSISGGADAARFNINPASGALTFAAIPDFEAPVDTGGDNIYNVDVQVADDIDGTDTQQIAVTVADVNESPTNTPPTISGTPATTVAVGGTYSFTPAASDVDAGDTLTFLITNKPAWASFDAATGELSGTPTDADVGTTTGVLITVSDGMASDALPAFDLAVTSDNDSNGDGITDEQAAAIGLDPQLADTDGDGISDADEVGGDPANPLDSDSDGVIDALEFEPADATILAFVVPAPTATALSLADLSNQQVTLNGNGAAMTAHNNGTTGLPLYAESDIAVADAGYTYPFGLYDFSVVAAGGTVTVTLTLPAGIDIPANAVVRKLGVGNQWRTLDSSAAVIDRTGNTVTLTLTDNDWVVDLDDTVGTIRDPFGVAVPVASSSGGGGGGCALGADSRQGGFDPILPLMALASLLYLQRPRRRKAA